MKSSPGEVRLFLGILIAAVLLVSVAVYPTLTARSGPAARNDIPPSRPVSREELLPAWSDSQGPESAPYVLVEFGDYQCPSCARAKGAVQEILKKGDGKIRHVFHHYQVMPSHKYANLLAAAAEAAQKQGRFWEMHDAIFKNQDRFKEVDEKAALDQVLKIAADLKLDVLKLRADMSSPDVKKSVQEMAQLAEKIEIHTTPTYFVIAPGKKPESFTGVDSLKQWFEKPGNFQ